MIAADRYSINTEKSKAWRYVAGSLLALGFSMAEQSKAAGSLTIKFDAENKLLQINAQQTPVAELMQQITQATGMALHYRMPKELVINGHCDKATFEEALTCLFGRELGLAVSYSAEGKAKEAWLSGIEGVDGNVASMDTQPVQSAQTVETDTEVEIAADSDRRELASLLKKVHSKEPARRLEALSNLASAGGKDDVNVRKTLIGALKDKNPAIRATAIASLARREGEGASIELQAVLNDSDVSVRLAAIDNAGNNSEFLQEALKNSDPMVRTIAEGKLKTLSRNAERKM